MMRTYLVREDDDVWYLDLGATCHMTSNKEWFIEYLKFTNEKFVYIGDDSKCQVEGIGTIPIILHNGKYKEIQNVLHAAFFFPVFQGRVRRTLLGPIVDTMAKKLNFGSPSGSPSGFIFLFWQWRLLSLCMRW
jgi:hypothetical protein